MPACEQQALSSEDITVLLRGWTNGDAVALNDVIPLVYRKLRQAAYHYLQHESGNHTLQPTALVNEVYLRLLGTHNMVFESRSQFFWFAGQLMRRILVEHARGKLAQKRGGRQTMLSLDDTPGVSQNNPLDLQTILALDQALLQLEQVDARKAKIVELRFFSGLEFNEISELMALSKRTVSRDWNAAKRWLAAKLSLPEAAPPNQALSAG